MVRSFLVAFMLFSSLGNCANILFVAPFPALSHYQMIEPLIVALIERKHNVTVISHRSLPEKLVNYTHVDVREVYSNLELDFSQWNLISDAVDLFKYGYENCENFSSSEKIQSFLRLDNRFDLIVLEAFDSECYLGFVAKYKVPFITFSSIPLSVWQSDWIYNPTDASYIPDYLCRLPQNMNFRERLQNVACHLLFRWLNWFENSRLIPNIIKKYYNATLEDVGSVKKNASLILTNGFHGVTGNRPLLPNVLEIGGIHLKVYQKPLPYEIDKFLNDSSDGVILISMGSIVKAHTADSKIRNEFVGAISKLKQRVLWKWETNFPNKPANLMTSPWLPQFDVLGHPKVKLFICHGGIHGIYEAIYHGIPIVGIPLFGDQMSNLKGLEANGVAVTVEYFDLNEKKLLTAINSVLSNNSYSVNAKKMSDVFRDRQQTPLEKVIFWTEYVIRHRGARHLRSGASDLLWIQYSFFDVVSIALLSISIFYYLIKFFNIIGK